MLLKFIDAIFKTLAIYFLVVVGLYAFEVADNLDWWHWLILAASIGHLSGRSGLIHD